MSPEIRSFEFALGLLSVLIGLAVAHIATAFSRLLRHASTVIWDPIAVVAALLAMLVAVNMWFDLWHVRDIAESRHYFFYLWTIFDLLLVYLLAAVSLPEETNETCDLRKYYERNRRHFWILVLLFRVSYTIHWFYFAAYQSEDWARMAVDVGAGLIIPITLLLTASRITNLVGIIFLIACLLWSFRGSSLT
jgi:hypothetical protein